MKPFDISKFRKDLNKSIPGISVGFHDPKTWIDSGNLALNYAISGDFKKGVPLGKVTMFAGQPGCLPASANVKVKVTSVVTLEVLYKKEVTVKELKELHKSPDVMLELLTPDGYQLVGQWFDKGVLATVELSTLNYKTVCATNHVLQSENGTWALATDVNVGDKLLTESGPQEVLGVKWVGEQECYDFEILHDNHRYWGDGFSSHNSGKSFICSGNIIRNAQKQNIFPILIDTENALDEKWLQPLGVATDEDSLLKVNMAMIDDVAKLISDFMKDYKLKYDKVDPEERPKVLFVLDSLGMLLTPTDVNQFEAGDLKGDMGRKPKALTALVRNCVNMFGEYEVGLVVTNHTYASQSIFEVDDIISGGQGFIYASSIVVAIQKRKLKEDEDGKKVTDVRGIRAACKIMKTRYNKPFETVEIKIPWDTGMNPYSGLVDLFEKKGALVKDGNKLLYTASTGDQVKMFRSEWENNKHTMLDIIMNDFERFERVSNIVPSVETSDDDEENILKNDE